MREIIYIQAGNVSNHIGTHFWNTQESYFTYDDDSEPLVQHDISFREGVSDQEKPTFCPRALIFDYKSNFGALSRYNDLYPDIRDADQPLQTGTWNGSVTEHQQEIITKSEYQKQLEAEENSDDTNGYLDATAPSKMRFWSDFNRVYYIPRSIQQVPDLPDWQANSGDWNHGKSIFKRYDLDTSMNEESLRRFLEESNNLQGFQMSFDNASFGGFSNALLESIKDELPKAPVLAFPVLSGTDPRSIDVEDVAARKLALQDAMCICALDDLAVQGIPILTPTSWKLGKWSENLTIDKNNLYQSSAVLSALIESATLPLRFKDRNEELSDFCSRLNWSQTTRLSHLSGIVPLRDDIVDMVLGDAMYNFSANVGPIADNSGQYLAMQNVSRGLSADYSRRIDEFCGSRTGLEEPYLSNVHAPAYPLPSSFPDIFAPSAVHSSSATTRASTTSSSTDGRSASLLSTLQTTTATADVLRGYAAFSQSCVSRRYRALDAAGLESDELRDMVEKLATMADAYIGEA